MSFFTTINPEDGQELSWMLHIIRRYFHFDLKNQLLIRRILLLEFGMLSPEFMDNTPDGSLPDRRV